MDWHGRHTVRSTCNLRCTSPEGRRRIRELLGSDALEIRLFRGRRLSSFSRPLSSGQRLARGKTWSSVPLDTWVEWPLVRAVVRSKATAPTLKRLAVMVDKMSGHAAETARPARRGRRGAARGRPSTTARRSRIIVGIDALVIDNANVVELVIDGDIVNSVIISRVLAGDDEPEKVVEKHQMHRCGHEKGRSEKEKSIARTGPKWPRDIVLS